MIKLRGDCGNEMEFNTIDKETGEQNPITDDEGQYAITDDSRFMLWENHDVIGIVCGKCGKAVWTFA